MQFFGIQPQPHGKFVTDLGPHGSDNVQQQSGAVLQRAAIVVFTLVVIGGQETGNDVTVGRVYFDTVEPGSFGTVGCLSKPVDHLRDVGVVHHPDR